jgi:hypothetical protein
MTDLQGSGGNVRRLAVVERQRALGDCRSGEPEPCAVRDAVMVASIGRSKAALHGRGQASNVTR